MDPYEVLRISREATDEEIRRAWIEGVRRHPPDGDPAGFRRLRRAYDLLRDPLGREAERLFGRPDLGTLSDLARTFREQWRRVDPELWYRVVKERAR